MSTLQDTPPHRHGTRARPGIALGLTALIGIGLALLIFMPTVHRTSAPTTANIAQGQSQTAALAAQTTLAPAGCFRDPATHALTCSHATPAPTATAARAGYFRDPANHKLLRLPTARHPAGQRPANQSRGRIIP